MSWQCKLCETENPDDAIECEVCGGVSPYLSRFDYDEINPSKPTTIRWKAEACHKVYIKYGGHTTDVTGINAVRIITRHDTKIVFDLFGDVADREYVYAVLENKPPMTKVRTLTDSDFSFISELCKDEDFKRFFTLDRYEGDVERFFNETLQYNKKGLTFTYVIENIEDETPVGMINCQIESEFRKVNGYITYAVLPIYRNYGVATEALSKMKQQTKNVGVDVLKMTISTANRPSMRVAAKCGFKCDEVLLKEAEEENASVMLMWTYNFSEHESKREVLSMKAIATIKEGKPELAIRLLSNALKFGCPKNSKFTDGKIYYLISEAYKEAGKYHTALDMALKAKDKGFNNVDNNRLIRWLEDHQFAI